MEKIHWIKLLLDQKVKNANEQLKGQELADVLNLLIWDYQNTLKNILDW